MDRESEPGDPAEAGGTWFDTPGDPSRAAAETPEPTWFDGPAQRKSLTGQDRPDAVNAGFLARATAEPPEAARARARLAILSEVERRARAWAPVVQEAGERGITPEQLGVIPLMRPWEGPSEAAASSVSTSPTTAAASWPRRTADEVRAQYAKGVRKVRVDGQRPIDEKVAEALIVSARTIRQWRHDGFIRYADDVPDL